MQAFEHLYSLELNQSIFLASSLHSVSVPRKKPNDFRAFAPFRYLPWRPNKEQIWDVCFLFSIYLCVAVKHWWQFAIYWCARGNKYGLA